MTYIAQLITIWAGCVAVLTREKLSKAMKDRAGMLNTRQAGLKQYCKVFHRKNLTVVRLWLGAP